MALPVITVASGGMPVSNMAAGGMPVTEVALALGGIPVTKVTGALPGLGVTYVSATGGPAVTYVTLDLATLTNVTLSGGNLVATNTGTTSVDQGARVASTAGKTSGKYYFEVVFTSGIGGANVGVGVGTTTSTYTGMGNSATTGVTVYRSNGNIWANGGSTGISLTAFSFGNTVGAAVDLDLRKIWFRKAPSGNWNNNASGDPFTNVAGINIPAGTMVPFLVFGGTAGTANNVNTANFGASAFVGAVPSGFTAGWPA